MDHINPKIDVLTSLRFFAAALIVIGHSSGMFGFPSDWPGGIATYQGVTFFFVLSGFILTYVYPSLDNKDDAARFLIARFARIWPAHFATFLVALLILPWVSHSLIYWQGVLAVILNLTLLHSWIPLPAFYFSGNGVSWSVSVELFFYLNFIWLIRNFENTWKLKLFISVAAAVFMMVIWRLSGALEHNNAPFSLSADGLLYVAPLGRFFEFVLGMCFAVVFKKIKATPRHLLVSGMWATIAELILVTLVVVQILFFGSYWFELGPPSRIFPIELTFWLERSGVAPLYGLTILIFAFQRGGISRVLSQKGFVLLGEISFSMYMLHQPILFWLRDNPEIFKGIPGPLAYDLFFGFTIGASYLMWRFIERPLRGRITKAGNASLARLKHFSRLRTHDQ